MVTLEVVVPSLPLWVYSHGPLNLRTLREVLAAPERAVTLRDLADFYCHLGVREWVAVVYEWVAVVYKWVR